MYTNILCATDLAENHYPMCQRAVEVAQKFQAKLFLLHVIETPPSVQLAQGLGFAAIDLPHSQQQDAKSVLRILGEDLGIPPERQLVQVGSIYQQIKVTLLQQRCELLIIGRHYHHHLFEWIKAHEEALGCDVLTLE